MRNDPAPVEDEALAGAALAVILGSGLGEVGWSFPVEARREFADIPGMGATCVEGHAGELTLCRVGGARCLFVRGRRHYYEGRVGEIGVLIAYLYSAGIRHLLLTSAAGSLSRGCEPGSLLLSDTLLDLQFRPAVASGGRPVSGVAQAAAVRGRRAVCGRRRPLATFDPRLREVLIGAARRARVGLGRGAVATTAGPSYETPAEVKFLQQLGISAVSMSGAPEVEVAGRLGIQIASVALVTNWATGISETPLSHDDVLACGRRACGDLRALVAELIAGGEGRRGSFRL
ncbi:MAG: purine-nucleoside phosphorylase [Candidatus Krumholzibacteriia bacterium]